MEATVKKVILVNDNGSTEELEGCMVVRITEKRNGDDYVEGELSIDIVGLSEDDTMIILDGVAKLAAEVIGSQAEE